MSKNNFKNNDTVKFIHSLREKLESIDLSDNNVGSAGSNAFFKKFSELTFNLTYLNLQNCYLGDRGSSKIVESTN